MNIKNVIYITKLYFLGIEFNIKILKDIIVEDVCIGLLCNLIEEFN